MKRIFSVAVLFLLACVLVRAQAPALVGPNIAAQHLLNHPQAVTPPIAQAAHIYGPVIVEVLIDQKGNVTSARPLSGPLMLRQAAADIVQRYTFRPFLLNEEPSAVSAIISVNFTPNGESKESDTESLIELLQAFENCDRKVNQAAPPADQVETCSKAAQLADALPADAHLPERGEVYVQYAIALIHDGNAAEAVDVGNKAIAVAQRQQSNFSGASAAYEVEGEALAVAGKLPEADKSLAKAESYQSKALHSPAGPQLKEHYSENMKALLQFHAKILTAMGNQKEADSKLRQAAKL